MARLGTVTRFTLIALGAVWSVGCASEQRSEQEGPCYAPGKNLSEAYEPGSVGCLCEEGDSADQCIEGAALVCQSGRWQAVIDGPCFPAPGEVCGDGFCSQHGHCEQQADGGERCVSGARSDASSVSSGPSEACASTLCTPYAYCDRSADAGATCRAMLNAGAACSEGRTCASGNCSSGTCVAGPDRTQGCLATWDCALESIARAICGSRDCEVCVQTVDAQGTPVVWAALEDASRCDCPDPRVSGR